MVLKAGIPESRWHLPFRGDDVIFCPWNKVVLATSGAREILQREENPISESDRKPRHYRWYSAHLCCGGICYDTLQVNLACQILALQNKIEDHI